LIAGGGAAGSMTTRPATGAAQVAGHAYFAYFAYFVLR
jgi:hypothetical protein